MNIENIIRYILPILLGVAITLMSLPYLYKLLPNDYSRTELIISTLKNRNNNADIVLFGSSIIMSGINSKELTNKLNKPHNILNLSSSAQTIKESSLYYQYFDSTYNAILQFIEHDKLLEDPVLLNSVSRNFRLLGYVPQFSTQTFLSSDEFKYINSNIISLSVDSRDFLINTINQQSRRIFRRDLDMTKINNDLFYPNTYTQVLSSDKYSRLIKQYNPSEPVLSFSPSNKYIEFLKIIAEYFESINVSFYVIINPINPDLFNYTEDYKNNMCDFLSSIQSPNLTIIDFSNILNSNMFIDHWHPNAIGKDKFEIELARVLNSSK